MAALRDEIKRIWLESFDDSTEYVDMYFNRVYRDEDALTANDPSGRPLSSLLLQRYTMQMHGSDIGLAYVAGAATRRQARGRGLMTGLLTDALHAARERGDAAVALIPATDALYFFYDRLGFATVFYKDIERYTAGHLFPGPGEWRTHDDLYDEAVAEAVERLERALPAATVLHSRRDCLNILDDLGMEPGGRFTAVEAADGHIAAMAWSVADSRMVHVKAVLAEDADARLAVLRAVRAAEPGLPFAVAAMPEPGVKRRLSARGMIRPVNVGLLLGTVAAAHPELKLVIHVTDPLLQDNTGTYRLAGGTVERPAVLDCRPDLDVSVDVLAALLYSDAKMGQITGLPSQRPYMALMLD